MKSIYYKKKYNTRNSKKPKKYKKPKKTKKIKRCKKKYCQKGCSYKKQLGGYGVHTELNRMQDFTMGLKDQLLGKQS